MNRQTLTRFRRALTLHRDRLMGWLTREATPAALSRCCLLPEGHPPGGPEADVEALTAIDAALERIEHGTFGQCTRCGGQVEPERLELDFTTCVCLDHYTPAERRALESDLELAARVQQHLFPRYLPALPGIEVAAHAHPARILSGDYYDFFYAGDRVQGFAIADVMGKGVAAGMLMANLQSALRILGPEHDGLDGLAGRLNTLFRYNLKLIRFISICLLTVDTETGLLHYCNAGHNPPLLWRPATATALWLKPTGPAIGLASDPPYHAETIQLQGGDVLVLYTDGLAEARNGSAEDFGEAELERFAARHHAEPAGQLLAGLHHAATRFAGGRLHDDVALLVIRRT